MSCMFMVHYNKATSDITEKCKGIHVTLSNEQYMTIAMSEVHGGFLVGVSLSPQQ